MADEMMMEEGMAMEEAVPPEEEIEGAPAGATITHTFDEIPDLEGAAIGDFVTFRITTTGDGQADMEFMEIAPGEPPAESPEAGGMGAGVAGQEALTERFV